MSWDIRKKLESLEEKIFCIEENFEQEAGSMQDIIEPGHKIARYINGAGVSKNLYETVTSLVLQDDNLLYTTENGTIESIDLSKYTNGTSVLQGEVDIENQVIRLINDDESEIEIDISDLLAEVVTSVSLNGNYLIYINEEGQSASINLSKYYISSATFNSETGIATFTRADNTTFTLNLSTLLNQDSVASLINTLQTGHSIGTFNNGDGQIVTIKETICLLTDNGDGTYSYTNENGAITLINTNPNFVIGISVIQLDPNLNGEGGADPKNGDIYLDTSEQLWFYNEERDKWYQGGGSGEGDIPNAYISLQDAVAVEGSGKRFIYLPNNIDGAIAYSQAWTPLV